MKYFSVFLGSLLFFGCSQKNITTDDQLPQRVHHERIAVFALENFTDTPQAGMRAANLVEGILIARGVQTRSLIATSNELTYDEKIALARKEQLPLALLGGVSEWRYKTGIDGEPAISLQLKLIDTHSGEVLWSATGSDNSWGTSSIGTTAQSLIESMVRVGKKTVDTKR